MVQAAIEEETLGVATAHAEFVPVTFAVDRAAAEDLLALFERHNVPALLDDEATDEPHIGGLSRGVAVLVPEQMHDAATALMARDDEDEDGYEDGDDDFEDDDDDFDDLDDLDDDYDEEEDDDFDDDVDEDDLD